MLNVSDIEAIKQRYEAIRNEYIKETGKDVLPPTQSKTIQTWLIMIILKQI